ncbi:MAG: LytTR family DNA-binding domain-containing protein [Sphingomonadales bacterium]
MAKERAFWIFQLSFWAVAGLALFASGLSQMDWKVALVRNIYFPFAGFLASFFLSLFYPRLLGGGLVRRLILICLVSFVMAVAATSVINPITAMQLGADFDELPGRVFFGGALNLTLVFLVWSLLYLQLFGPMGILRVTEAGDGKASKPPRRITVEAGGRQLALEVAKISMVRAAGDYAEVVSEGREYLKRTTIKALEDELGAAEFQRVHRSMIVNAGLVSQIEPRSKGEYLLHMSDGSSARSSRSYRDAIRLRFGLKA